MEAKTYRIGKISFLHSELTWAQDKALVQLIMKISRIAGEDEALSMKDLPRVLAKHDLLGEFWGIVLQRKVNFWFYVENLRRIWRVLTFKQSWRFVNLDPVTNTQLGDMFDDFFLINKAFMKKLSTFGNALGLIAQTVISSSDEEKQKKKDSEAGKEKKLKSKPSAKA